jgi:hypothetical protein
MEQASDNRKQRRKNMNVNVEKESYAIVFAKNSGLINDDISANQYVYDDFLTAVTEYAKCCLMKTVDYQVLLVDLNEHTVIKQFSSKCTKENIVIR